MRRIRSSILIGFIPIDRERSRRWVAAIAREDESAISVSRLPSRLTPDPTDLVPCCEMIFDHPYQAKVSSVREIFPDTSSQRHGRLTRVSYVPDDKHSNAGWLQHAFHPSERS